MKKVGLLVLVMLGFAKVSSAADYSIMSANELNEALIIAVKKGSYDEVQKLVRAGANGNQKITYIKSNYDDYDSNITCTLLEYAAKHGYVYIVKELIVKAKNDDINKALILAAKEGHANVARELVQGKPKVDAINTALISSAGNFPGITSEGDNNKHRVDLEKVTGIVDGFETMKIINQHIAKFFDKNLKQENEMNI